jgi:hypothetical protein
MKSLIIALMIAAVAGASPPAATYVVHSEASAATALRDRLDHELGWTAAVPTLGERVTIRARGLWCLEVAAEPGGSW